MAKRKREPEAHLAESLPNKKAPEKVTKSNGSIDVKTPSPSLHVQIVTGSYERVLHGITASLSNLSSPKPDVQFADTFLFNAHASAIRCLAIAPLPHADAASDGQGVFLATGGSDERVNVYSLSASPLSESSKLPSMPTLGTKKISENPQNRELGNLVHHTSNITALHFPTRSKLFSASEDNTIAISRTRDLSVVSTVKAPRPKALGQPSGDTAPVGVTPSGINDFAIHPSMKLMISVGRGERCMRLWDLLRGKKAGVLNFDRQILQQVQESKYSSGEGRKVTWNRAGTEFAILFERGAIVFDIGSSRPLCAMLPHPPTKVHRLSYCPGDSSVSQLAISTEDGRLIFFDTANIRASTVDGMPFAQAVAQLGGKHLGDKTRIKDFRILGTENMAQASKQVVVTANSDGVVKVWVLEIRDFVPTDGGQPRQVGILIGQYETASRITCLDAFVMQSPIGDLEGLSEFEGLTDTEVDSSDDSQDD